MSRAILESQLRVLAGHQNEWSGINRVSLDHSRFIKVSNGSCVYLNSVRVFQLGMIRTLVLVYSK